MARSTTITEQYVPIILNREKLKDTYHPHDGLENVHNVVGKTLRERTQNINTDVCGIGEEDAFFVADMGEVYKQQIRWKMNLKRVKPHYGKVVNPAGFSFD